MQDVSSSAETAIHAEFTLRPSRSLTSAGRKAFSGSLLAAGGLASLFAIKSGAWPIALFIGIAVAGAIGAMHLSTRSGREYEHLRLTDNNLEIRHYKPGFKEEAVFNIPSYMLRVETICDKEGRCERLLLKSGGKTIEIGAFLPPEEKPEFAKALQDALRKAATPQHLYDKPVMEP